MLFTKDLLGQKRSGQLACSQEEIEHHLKETYSDPLREQELGECSTLINPPGPSVQFNMAEQQLNEVRVVARKARASSAPGPSSTSYKVYKNCPKLLLRLWRILRVIWRRGRIPEQWRVAAGVWIPKVRDLIADYYSNFRMRTSSGAVTSGWHKIEIGIITGCTISVILFSLAMNMLTKSAGPGCRGPKTKSAQR
ncbi:hypothetical protein DPEC_G00062920 [Dallia pectoralis]|uniref:Uncharacterized protein n=1 Tax=Dallia pectoralis TaxID=75939 RepID=A0ACC2H7G6_DALPE|nr:hypothetical protein DPEC_G00062920 [Dallia pectoralis]